MKRQKHSTREVEIENIIGRISKPIDLTDIGEALQEHAYLFQNATRDLPELKHKMLMAKFDLERVASRVSLELRHEAARQNVKITEKSLNEEVVASEDYQRAYTAHIDAVRAHNQIDHVREVFLRRETSLRRLCDLYSAQYFAVSGESMSPKNNLGGDDGSGFKAR